MTSLVCLLDWTLNIDDVSDVILCFVMALREAGISLEEQLLDGPYEREAGILFEFLEQEQVFDEATSLYKRRES